MTVRPSRRSFLPRRPRSLHGRTARQHFTDEVHRTSPTPAHGYGTYSDRRRAILGSRQSKGTTMDNDYVSRDRYGMYALWDHVP